MVTARTLPAAERIVTALVYTDVAATTLLGGWHDIGSPSFRVSIGTSADTLTLTLPRRYGRMDEPSERGSAGTLACRNLIELRVTHPYEWRPGSDPTTWGTVIFKGTIEEYAGDPLSNTVDVQVASLGRLLAQGYVGAQGGSGVVTDINGQAAGLAHSVVPAWTSLVWDTSANLALTQGGLIPTFIRRDGDSIIKLLDELKDQATSGTIYYVTAAGLFRWHADSQDPTITKPGAVPQTGRADHYLTVGQQITAIKPWKASKSQVGIVYVVYAGGLAQSLTGPGYTASDKRVLHHNAPDITDATIAGNLATTLFNNAKYLTLRVTLTVPASRYPIETIQLGDRVVVQIDRDLPDTATFIGYEDLADVTLTVAAYGWSLDGIELELAAPQPRPADQIYALYQEQQKLADELAARIETARLADLAVTTAKIADAAVTTAKIAPLAVTTATLNDAVVTTAKIAAYAVTAGLIGINAVTNEKLVLNAITSDKVTDLNITEAKLAALAVTNGKIALNAVTTDKVTDLNITEAKLAALAVTNGKIADLNVTEGKIANLNVTEGKIAALAVTNAKINDVAPGKLSAGTFGAGVELPATQLGAGAVPSGVSVATTLLTGTVATAQIADLNVTEGKIAALAVVAGKLAAQAVTTDKTGLTTQTTVGAAGTADTLPVKPTIYLKVKDAAGTEYIVPGYAPV